MGWFSDYARAKSIEVDMTPRSNEMNPLAKKNRITIMTGPAKDGMLTTINLTIDGTAFVLDELDCANLITSVSPYMMARMFNKRYDGAE